MCVTAVPMREGPSKPAGRSRFQITFGGFGQKPWSGARKEKAWEEPGQMAGKKRTAREPLITCRKRRDDVKTAGSRYRGMSFGGACFTDRSGIRHGGGLSLLEAVMRNVGTWSTDVNGEAQVEEPRGESTEAVPRGGFTRSSCEVRQCGWSEGVKSLSFVDRSTSDGRSRPVKHRSSERSVGSRMSREVQVLVLRGARGETPRAYSPDLSLPKRGAGA